MTETACKDPFEHLGREHAAFGHVFQLLARLLDQAEAGGGSGRAALRTVVDYMDLFGDLGHHDKEESLLVPVLIQHGFDWFEGPLAQMRRDHRQERYLLRALSQLTTQEAAWSAEDVRRFAATGRGYLALMKRHLELENHEIFDVARTKVPAAAQAALLAEFGRFDAEHAESTDAHALRAELEALLAEYGA